MEQLDNLVVGAFFPGAQALLQEYRWCDDGCSGVPQTPPDLQAEMEALWKVTVTTPWENGAVESERQAYDATNDGYTALIEDIRGRAQQEGWQCQ